MTNKPNTPTLEQVRWDYYQAVYGDTLATKAEILAGFDRWLAGIKMTERLFMLAQIMDVADFDPGQKDEYGRIEIPAYTVIDVHELNEIARLEDHEFMAITVEDLEKHASMIEAAAEQRGAAMVMDALKREASDSSWEGIVQPGRSLQELVDHIEHGIRADQMEGDE